MSERLNSVSTNRESTINKWVKTIEEAKRRQSLMFASLAKYKKAIERAMVEIENSRAAAADVLLHKKAIEEHIAMLTDLNAIEIGRNELGNEGSNLN